MSEENPRDDHDFLTALAIGAVVGIGAALLFRASDDFDREKIIKRMKPMQKKAGRALNNAGRHARHTLREKLDDASAAGRIVRRSGGRIASNLGDDAAKIVREARREIEESARDSVKQAQRAMRRAAKRLV
ncbi:MAG: hypothetical protein ABIS27_13395 [Longimicrobiales bacterium]